MTLHAHRSQRVEDLVESLAAILPASWSDDPFEAIPIVVGSRGMESWLRHELATRLGSVARVEFLFPRTAFEGAARWLLARPKAGDRSPFWSVASTSSDEWAGARLVARVVPAIRARLDEPAFTRVRAYLRALRPAVSARELTFAGEVAATLERLLHDRAETALEWARGPGPEQGEHEWLAWLLADLHAAAREPSPAATLARLGELAPRETRRPLFVFGLSTLRPGDKARIAALARFFDVHLFALAPSSEWWEDVRNAREQRAALRDADDPDAIAALLAELDRANGLLATSGGPSRDLQIWLEDVGYEAGVEQRAPPPRDTLLAKVQAWVDAAAENPRRAEAPWRDASDAHDPEARGASLEIHACHGALRQCEALRDELLRRFAADETLEPRHVLVMTPDVASHAPLLAAVLGRSTPGGAPAIPLHVADLGLRATNPLADALSQVLALADERVTASRLLELLSLRPVRERFGLGDDDLADVRRMIVDSGMRWAWDADDRAAHDQPRLDQSTLRFGLERLALGVLMHEADGLEVIATGASRDLGPAAPLDLSTRERVARFGHLAELCDELRRRCESLREPANRAEWRARLREVLDGFTLVDGDAAWLRGQVEDTLAELLPEAGDDALLLDRSAIAALISGAFEVPRKGERPATGAVTVCGLEPMRSVPFRVIAVVGLDDGAFPRAGKPAAWDPFSRPRRGEDDRRGVDRHMFLEALLCARDALLLFGTGFEEKRGERVPLSIVATELAELVAAGLGCEADEVAIAHPLQPWSETRFSSEAQGRHAARRLAPFDRVWVEGAEALRSSRVRAGLPATRLDAAWPPEEARASVIGADDLARALAAPQEELLRRRVGLLLGGEDVSVSDREPIEPDNLDRWSLAARVLEALDGIDPSTEPDVDALEARLRAEGELPLAAAGRRVLEDSCARARDARANAARVGGARAPGKQASCEVEGVSVISAPRDVRVDERGVVLVYTTPSKAPNAKLRLVAWVNLLVFVAAGEPALSAHVVGHEAKGRVDMAAPPSAAAAREMLGALVRLRDAARCSPLRLFRRLSPEVARLVEAGDSAADAIAASYAEWEGAPQRVGDLDDVWVSALFEGTSIDDLVAEADVVAALASAVFAPMLEAEKRFSEGAAADEPAASDAPEVSTKRRASTKRGKA